MTTVEQLALQAGAARFYPEAQNVTEQNYVVSAGFLQRFHDLVIEMCAVVPDELGEHYSAIKDTALLNGDVELSNASSGEPRACIAIADAIRARKDSA